MSRALFITETVTSSGVDTVLKLLLLITRRTGSHVGLPKITHGRKVGTVVSVYKKLKIGTLKGVLKLAKVDADEFSKYL